MFKFENRANDSAEISVYGIIGSSFWVDGLSAGDFKKQLRALGQVKTIDLRINSEGGYVTDALAMYYLLNDHPADITVHVDGLAASAASFLAMCGKKIVMAEGGFMMIHNVRGGAMGEAKKLEAEAQVIRSQTAQLRKVYSDRTANSVDKIKDWMDEETWFDSSQAIEHGFATEILHNVRAVACVSTKLMSSYERVPVNLRLNRVKLLEMRKIKCGL
jgi:ATP-dependent Clp protease, protease subunit